MKIGSYDIKQSLITKRRQDRTEQLQLPDEAEPGALFELGLKEYKNGNTEIAIVFISKANSSTFYSGGLQLKSFIILLYMLYFTGY